ncbi:MAG TPA: hypothetical protein P5277_04360 [Candidatus Paceibacterota bacterium]|nr:hypothetical protein [Candidatus Paceibacterota bacterium]
MKKDNQLIKCEQPNLFQKLRDIVISTFEKKDTKNLNSNSQKEAI